MKYVHSLAFLCMHEKVEGLLTNKATSRTRNVIGGGGGSGSGGGGGEGMQEEPSLDKSSRLKRVSLSITIIFIYMAMHFLSIFLYLSANNHPALPQRDFGWAHPPLSAWLN